MKKKLLIVIVLLTFVVVIFGFIKKDTIKYKIDTNNMEHVGTNEVEKLLQSKQKKVIYVGRATCPYCRKFVPKLDQVIKETKQKVYYYDSAKNKENSKFKSIITKLKIETVPALVVIENGEVVESIQDSSLSVRQIKKYLK